MKVRLEVNLKTANGAILPKGSIFSDEKKPLPSIIARKIGTKMVTVIEDRKIIPTKVLPETFTFEEKAPEPQEVMPLQEKTVAEVSDSTKVEEYKNSLFPVKEEEEEEPTKVSRYRRRGRRKKDADDN